MGNICRSPAAECVMRSRLAGSDLEGSVEIDSAGTIAYHSGNPPDARMCEAGSRRGIRVEGRARQIKRADLERFDLIVVMDDENFSDVRRLDREGAHWQKKLKKFTHFCSAEEAHEVPDPYYGGPEGFERVFDLLEDGCGHLIEFARAELEERGALPRKQGLRPSA